jgi:hypothetical protein
MIQLEHPKTRSKTGNKVVLDVEKEKDTDEPEVQRLKQLLQGKRVRTHATTVDDHEECDKKSSDDWDLDDYRREVTLIQNRRSTPLGSRAEVPTPQEGKTGPLEHSRLGLVGWIWIAYWSLGNCALAVKIIVGLIRKLNVTESVFETVGSQGLPLGEARSVGFCTGSGAMVH